MILEKIKPLKEYLYHSFKMLTLTPFERILLGLFDPSRMDRAQIKLITNSSFYYWLIFSILSFIVHTFSGLLFIVSNYNNIFLFCLVLFSFTTPICISFTVDSSNVSAKTSAFCRIVKFYCLATVLMAFNSVTSFDKGLRIAVLTIIFAALDIYRAFFVESVKSAYRKRLKTGTYQNILKFERIVQYELGKISKEDFDRKIPDNIFMFYSRGVPVPLDLDLTFRRWAAIDDSVKPFQVSAEIFHKTRIDRPFFRQSEDLSYFTNRKNGENSVYESYWSPYTRIPHFEPINDFETLRKAHLKFPDKTLITMETLERLYDYDDAHMIYEMVSYDLNRDVTWNHFKWNVRQINIERSSLYCAIADSKKLSRKVSVLSTIILYIIMTSLTNFVINFDVPLLRISAPVLLFAFLMVLKDSLGPFVFIIFTNPFITGDRVLIEDEAHIVQEINIFSSIFWKWSGERVYISNKYLAEHSVQNIRKSARQKFEAHLIVSASTPPVKIKGLQLFLESLTEKYPRYFTSITCDISKIENSDKITLLIYVEHETNFQLGIYRWNRHQFFMTELINYLQENQIEYIPIEQPIKINNIDSNAYLFQTLTNVAQKT
ncbi:Small Conductance Mechanosensitive Ion Channel (MscS) Family [Pseudoloma neurophilia]|uniref:Small Conductance Mechanosensitive Ion Channel (MscS) Family n=1 Tax=Pseudoloma neurophilia TaxID=146866 RepID=A0A0R0M256_9MICR|nr:Small Conductance Mechanosensitive Ion Channel (MscS) Family [Pseudoloma neurophilia]